MPHLARPTTAVLVCATALVAGTALVGGASSATAATHGDFFVVETQFLDAPSPILDSGGAFAGCTTVTDLFGIAEQFAPNRLMFIGDKQVNCAGGSVVIHYNATTNLASGGRRTVGHWFVVESSLPGVTAGSGTVRGDSTRRQVADGSGGCILDVFAGQTQ